MLAAKGIPYELSEIDLTVPRPDWYLKNLNPNGTVPSMLHNGHNIYESLVCCGKSELISYNSTNQILALFYFSSCLKNKMFCH